MAIQTKAQLSASNNTAFPDNNTGYITPEILRGFNTASIDSYAALSGSNVFVGNQVITGSVVATSFTGSLLGTASLALTASTVALTSDNGNQNHKVLFSNSTGSNETLLYDPNDFTYNPNQNLLTVTASYANFAVSASYASASTSASFALVANSANTIGSTTINGIQTYTYSQTLNTGGSLNLKETRKFVTGSFGCISGSWTKFMNVSHSTANWRGTGVFAGTNMTSNEFGITQTNFVLRAGNTSDVSSTSIKAGTNTVACPDVSASWNGSSMDLYARSNYNLTGSLLVDMTINLSVTGSTITFF